MVPLKFKVPVDAVNVPPLPRFPPTFNVPASENTIRESTPENVILPETVAVPVDISIRLSLTPPVVACRATEAAEKVPAPTLIVLVELPFLCIVTAPLAASEAVLSARLIAAAPAVPVVKAIVVH